MIKTSIFSCHLVLDMDVVKNQVKRSKTEELSLRQFDINYKLKVIFSILLKKFIKTTPFRTSII